MTSSDDYTPSLVEGLVRYRTTVLLVTILMGALGGLYAIASWQPTAELLVNVQVAPGSSFGTNQPDRVTSEVAADLSSPEVVDAASAASAAEIDDVTSFWSQGDSTVKLVVEAGTAEGAEAGAEALLPAYEQVSSEQRTSQLASRIGSLDLALASVNQSLDDNLAQLGAPGLADAQVNRLQSERDNLLNRRSDLEQQRDNAQLDSVSPPALVTVAAGPNAGPGRMSLLLRYAPAGMVIGLVASMIAVAWVARRRPWLTSPEVAGRVLGAPLLAVGDKDRVATDDESRDEVAPVLAMLTLRSTADTASGIALLVPCGDVDAAATGVADDMRSVLERAGAKVAVMNVAASGRTAIFGADGGEEHVDGLWTEFSGREHFEATLGQMGVDADLLVLVPDERVEHEVLLDLMLLADVTVVATRTGTSLEPLLALRRDFDAIGRDPRGVVADLVVR